MNYMSSEIELISTDFDGTLFASFENPPVPPLLMELIARLQARGAKWVINTGRNYCELMETLGRVRLPIDPDYFVVVEREIYVRKGRDYVPHKSWNQACTRAHAELFATIRPDLPRLADWVHEHFSVAIYADSYSPFCFIAKDLPDADRIQEYVDDYCKTVPHLTLMRNSVYARLSHDAYNKGSSMAEVASLHGIPRERIFAVGDHLNDLHMLAREYAGCVAAPDNAVEPVKEFIRQQGGYLSPFSHGHGVADALEHFLKLDPQTQPS